MSLRLTALADRLRSSLFFVPMLWVAGGAALGVLLVEVDRSQGDAIADLPFVLTTTVEGARELLSTIAAATITVAGIAFSVSLLVLQMASSQYSPRVVESLFRDALTRRVMGLVVGTFTYCLMVLRSVRGALEEGGDEVVPNLSVGAAIVLGVVAILGIVAFIDHAAHRMEVSRILDKVTAETIREVERWGTAPSGEVDTRPLTVPPTPGLTVRFDDHGWVQHVSYGQLLDLVDEAGTVRLETGVGRYAVPGTPLCTLWPSPNQPEEASRRARRSVRVGAARTLRQDELYGIRQLADVALRALSPGVNDPTTAQDAIFHLAAALETMLVRELPPRLELGGEGRRLLLPERPDHAALVGLAFDEIRRVARDHPTVCIYLLEALHLVDEALGASGLDERSVEERRTPLLHQAALIVEESERSSALPEDRRAVLVAYQRRFPSGAQPV